MEQKTPPPHRRDDSESDDYRPVRRSYPSLKQTLGSLALILLPLVTGGLIWFAVQDRSMILQSIRTVDAKADTALTLARDGLANDRQQDARYIEQRADMIRWMESLDKRLDEIRREVKQRP